MPTEQLKQCPFCGGFWHEIQEHETNYALVGTDTDARYIITRIYNDLPQNRDWLDPQLEKAMKNIIGIK